jgi:predicted N-formylglutamate amidohydrolase
MPAIRRLANPSPRCDRSARPKPSVEGSTLTETALIAANEPPPFELIEGDAAAGIVLVCDHASRRIPAALEHLGVPECYRDAHIAWDIGAGAVTRRLQQRFAADAVIANYSRLVVDLNRGLGDTTGIPPISDGVLIPGNLGLDAAARAARVDALHAPYHAAIEALIARRSTPARLPVFLGIHSFTPRFHSTERPWHVGVLWDRDPRLAVPLLAALRARGDLVVGDNEPYSGRHTADYSIDLHAESRGLAHVGIELRQDLVADEAGQDRVAALLGDALEPILRDEAVFGPLSPVNPIAS